MRTSIFVILILLPPAAFAEGPKKMDAVDFLVDRDGLVGKQVTVTGCRVVGASIDNVPCKTGTSIFYVESSTLDRESLRHALRFCATFDDLEACDAEVSGVVGKVNYRIGLSQAKIVWKHK